MDNSYNFWGELSVMYYSSIGILAILILIIINYNLLFRFKNKDLDQTHKAYKFFLISVGSFYIADILWSPLYILNVRIINFIETSLYFVIMAFSVYFWTKYVILYLNEKNSFAKFLSLTGIIFLVAQIIVLTVNLFVPIAFWFEEDGTYHTSIARNINLATQVIIFILVDLYMIRVILRTDGNIRRRHLAIGLFCLNMILFITLQALDPYMPYYSIGCMLGTCLLHTFVLEDEKAAHKEHLESILKVEEMQELELGKTRKMAYSDPLTGVKNKMAYIEDVGGIEQKIEDEFLKDFGIVVFDLNDLKKINDTYGHDAGDKYIKSASNLICNKFKHSPVYRIGGDEFVVFLYGDDYNNRNSILIDFGNIIENNLKTDGVIIAFGYADYATQKIKGFMRLFETADKKMYEHKQELKSKKLKLSQ